ncbi:hypothetical protein AB0I94_02235 [Streptomyces sp. NPDC050147]|uniref:hypothetical protein n=1 Tax=Streptomyces sp. NPDC050147 TaxID=3155513 RepID=UPI00342E34A0
MTDRPYTDDDLRTEAARQHATLTEDPDYVGVGEQMDGTEVTPDGGVTWDDFSLATYDTAQRAIHDLISGAADVSAWAINLGADGLEPSEDTLSIEGDEKPIVRVHFAFATDMPADVRESFVTGVSGAIATHL